jgi:small subunit ribosomal protein S11
VNVLNENKQTLFFSSGGRLKVKGTLKTSNFILQELGEKIGSRILRLQIGRVCIFFKNINNSRNFFIKGFKKCGLSISLISELLSLPHNGCRLRKRRRV